MDELQKSYYYQRTVKQKKERRSWIPRFIRRFHYRYPKQFLVFTSAGIVLFWLSDSIIRSVYHRSTLTKEEYKQWVEQERQMALRRAMVGEGLRIPFTNQTFNMYSDEEMMLSDLHHEKRKKVFREHLAQIEGYFTGKKPMEVPDDD